MPGFDPLRDGDPTVTALRDSCYDKALGAVAMGLTRTETLRGLLHDFPSLRVTEIVAEMESSLTDALRSGVEREDVDVSWFKAEARA